MWKAESDGGKTLNAVEDIVPLCNAKRLPKPKVFLGFEIPSYTVRALLGRSACSSVRYRLLCGSLRAPWVCCEP